MKPDFQKSLIRSMLISAAVVVPVGLVIAGLIGGEGVLAGAAVGFALAVVHSVIVVRVLAWALSKPPQMLPSIMMASYFARVAALAAVLYGLHFVKALDTFALLIAFLALYITHSAIEIAYAFKSFGILLKNGDGK